MVTVCKGNNVLQNSSWLRKPEIFVTYCDNEVSIDDEETFSEKLNGESDCAGSEISQEDQEYFRLSNNHSKI
jgi:hypothetical protein